MERDSRAGGDRRRWFAVAAAAIILAGPSAVPAIASASPPGATAVSSVSVALSTSGALARQVTYTVDFTTSASGGLSAGTGTITLEAPPGTQLPNSAADYEIGGVSGSISAAGVAGNGPRGNGFAGQGQLSGPIVSLTVKTAVAASAAVVLTVLGATNPAAGSESLTMWTSADVQPVASSTYTVGAGSSVTGVTATASTLAAGATGVTWKVGFTTGAGGGLASRQQPGSAAGAITLVAPGGTVLSNQSSNYTIETGSGTPITTTVSFTGNRTTATVEPNSAAVGASTPLTLVIRDVVNPPPGPLDVQVSTSAQPNPVTVSGGTVVAATSVSGVTLSVSTPAAGAAAVQWTVGFTTSSEGALLAGADAGTVTLTAPPGTVFPNNGGYYKIDGTKSPYGVSVGVGGSSVVIQLATPVGTLAAMSVAIAGVTDPVAGDPLEVSVRTSSDTEPTTATASARTTAGESAVTGANLAVSSAQVGATGTTWTVTFTTSADGALASGTFPGTITLIGAPGTLFPTGAGDFKVNGNYPGGPQVSPDGSSVTIPVGQAVAASTKVTVSVAGVTNPSTASATLTVRTSSDLADAPAPAVPLTGTAVTPSKVTATSLSVTSPEAGSQTTWTVDLTTSASGALAAGTGDVRVAAPAGTNFAGLTSVTVNGKGAGDYVTNDATVVTVPVPTAVPASTPVTVVLAGVTNPPNAGSLAVTVSTSADTALVPAPAVTLAGPGAVSGVTVSASTPAGDALANWTVALTTSANGSIAGNVPAFELTFPPGTQLGQVGTVTVNGTGVNYTDRNGGPVLTVWTPTAGIGASSAVSIVVSRVLNPPSAGPAPVAVSSTADVLAVSASTVRVAAAAAVSTPSVSLSAPEANAAGVTMSLTFTVPDSLPGTNEGKIAVELPPGTYAPQSTVFGECGGIVVDHTTASFNGTAGHQTFGYTCWVTGGGTIITGTLGNGADAGDSLTLSLDLVSSPPEAATGLTAVVWTSSDVVKASSSPYGLASSVGVSNLSVAAASDEPGAQGVTYAVQFTTSSGSGGLAGGAGSITIVAPMGTVFPGYADCGGAGCPIRVTDLTHGTKSTGLGDYNLDVGTLAGGSILQFEVGGTIPAGDRLRVMIKTVTNTPVNQPDGQLTVLTSSDPEPVSTALPIGIAIGGTVTGSVKESTGGAEPDGPVSVCPSGGGACYLTSTTSDGNYHIGPVPDGSYVVTAYPSNSQVLLQSAPAKATVTGTTGVTVPTLTLGAPTSLQDAGVKLVTAGGTVETSGYFFVNWNYTFQLQIRSTACAPGTQTQLTSLIITADNLQTGEPFTVDEPVTGATVRSTGQIGAHGNPVRLVTVSVPPPIKDAVHGGVHISGHVSCRTASSRLPTVTGLSQSSGGPGGGTVVTVTGTNFTHVTGVKFGTVPAASFTPVSATELQAVSPRGQGSVGVTVSNQLGASKPTAADDFEYNPPKVTGVSPATGSPGTRVAIGGSGFTGATAVRFGSVLATGLTVVSDTDLSATVPAGTGTVTVTVTTPSGSSATSTADRFTYAGPVVDQVSPPHGTHVGGTEVVVEGTGFSGATKVVFGTVAATKLQLRSANELTVDSPPHTTGTVVVRVTTPNGTSTGTLEPGKDEFTYGGTLTGTPGDPPKIDDLSNDEDGISGGHQLTINGDNFYTISGVTFGGVAAAVTSFTKTSVVVTIPASTVAGAVPVVVTGVKGSSTPVTFTYESPHISQVTPDQGNVVGGDTVTVQGCWFSPLAGVTTVTFGTFAGTVTKQAGDCYVTGPTSNAERITVTTPSNYPGTTTVTVTVNLATPTGTSNAAGFDYQTPTITAVTPQTVPATGGVSVYLQGKGFQPKQPAPGTGTVTTVTFGGNAGTIIDVTPTEIIATVPPGTPGTTVGVEATVNVTLPNGTTYTAFADPTVTYACPDGSLPSTTTGMCTTTTPTPPPPPKTPTSTRPTTGGTIGTIGGYVDPGGTVTGTTPSGTTAPLAGATATLETSTFATGPFTAVPSGSDVMSPADRTNPQSTDALGGFAWTTLPGNYDVTASAPGCTPGSTAPFSVPPPQEGLTVNLECSSLPARTATTTSVTGSVPGITAGGVVTFHATVNSGGGAPPTGTVTFTSRSTTLGTAVVDPSTGKASLAVSSLPSGSDTVTASYSGDAGHLPSSGSATELVSSTPAAYTAVPPQRICDTRTGNPSDLTGTAAQCNGKSLKANTPTSITVAGKFGVPAGATAVVLNVTAVTARGPGYLTAYPAGVKAPTASNLNFPAGGVVANLVEVGTGSGGKVSLVSNTTTDVVVDLEGYVDPATATGAGLYNPLASPVRICDTRAGNPSGLTGTAAQCNGKTDKGTTLAADSPHPVKVDGLGGVPKSGVSAVVLNVTVTDPVAPGYLTAYPAGESPPTASNVNFTAGETVPNRVILPVPATGEIDLVANVPTDAIVDVSGWFSAASGTGSSFTPGAAPVRICDTRPGNPSGLTGTAAQCNGKTEKGSTLGPGSKLTVKVRGLATVPPGATAVVLNVTAVTPTTATYLTVYPSGTPPIVSDLNPTPGDIEANLVVATLSATGTVTIYNYAGHVNVVVDVAGWYT